MLVLLTNFHILSLTENDYTVGRSLDNDIVIQDPKVSLVHFIIQRKDNFVILSDVKSIPLTHGTEILIQPDYYFVYLDPDTRLELYLNKFYITQKVLGSGSFASVKLAIDTFSNVKVACKIIDIKSQRLTNTTKEQIQSEISVLSTVKHRNIVQLLDSCVIGTKFYVFMILVHGGELFDKIVEDNGIAEAESK
ncbi:Checkpoint kinase 2 [Terramyces sp. JEL0728]|nr:Checkpoint kinase 2 [Terramyces sp. JEL0728]